jgi:hypothetical protein
MRRLVAMLLLVGLSAPAAARLRVCTLALNGPDEVEAFRAYLGADDFDFVDLSSALTPEPSADATAPPIRCPPTSAATWVVISAEFGGRFFGTLGRSVSLQDLEEASCQAGLRGVFTRRRRCFLLACNTLADERTRTRGRPADYLSVLRADTASRRRRGAAWWRSAMDLSARASARRLAESSRAFPGSTASRRVAARGRDDAQCSSRATSTAARTTRASLLAAWDDPGPESPSSRPPSRTREWTQVVGSSPDGSRRPATTTSCRGSTTTTRRLVDRLGVVRDLMAREDALSFVPTRRAFLATQIRPRSDAKERAVIAETSSAADDAAPRSCGSSSSSMCRPLQSSSRTSRSGSGG